MSSTQLQPNSMGDRPSDTIDPNELENLTDDELLKTLQSLEQEKEVLAQQQLLQEIDKLQDELRQHEKKQKETTGDSDNDDVIYNLPIDELSERLEDLKRQRDELSNKRLMEEIDSLQRDIQQLQIDTDYRETKVIAIDAVAVYALSPTEIKVCWIGEEFGEVESFTVYYKMTNQNDEEYESIELKKDANSCVISALVPHTSYQIKMEAAGSDKSEIKTDVVEVSTRRSVTSFVLIISNYDEFQLKALQRLKGPMQDAVDLKDSFEKMGSEVVLLENITGTNMVQFIQIYKQKLDDRRIDSLIVVLSSYKYHGYIFGTDGGILINKLIDALKYEPKVDSLAARNKPRIVLMDTVKIKEEIIEELDESYQPRHLRVRFTDFGKVEISFQQPKLADDPVSCFVVTLTSSDNPVVKQVDASSPMETYTCEFVKLKANTEYKFELYAVYPNHKGQAICGFIKTPSSQNRKDSRIPRRFGLELISQSQIYAFWKPATLENSDSLSYRISIRNLSNNETDDTIVTYPCHVFDNLKQNTLYNIRVTSVKMENNNSEESEAADISITTPQDVKGESRTGTPIIMADTTTAHILGEPNFLVASATGALFPDESKSFLTCFREHLEQKYHRFDITSLIQDTRNEIIYSSGRYDTPIMSSTLDKSVFLGRPLEPEVEET